MTGGHKRKRSYSGEDATCEHSRSSHQPCLQARINELIEKHQVQDPPLGRSMSQSLISGFILHIWPDIRDEYRRMTQYLEQELKRVLKERHIDAEVVSRVKEESSITKTLKRRELDLIVHQRSGFESYQDIFREMHDLSGLRIVLMNPEDRQTSQEMIEELFQQHKPPSHFHPSREVGHFWKKPWFGAYETQNHRVHLVNDDESAWKESHRYSGVMFEVQLTTFSDNLYNKLAHDLLYKADPGLVTGQEEMVIDVSHGLARCFELCMRILRPKLHRDSENRRVGASESLSGHTEDEVQLARSTVDAFEQDLHNRPKSDRIVQQLRKLLNKKEDSQDQECLKDLLSSDPRVDKVRIETEKGGLLPSACNWILEDNEFRRWREDGQSTPFWITGAPGKGKTMMLCGIIDELTKDSEANVSFFFCQGTDKRLNSGTAVLRGLLFFLLCKQQHSLISHIRHMYDDVGEKLFEDPNAWFSLSGILKNTLKDPGLRQTYIIVDALDECLPESRQLLAKLIVWMSSAYPIVKWVVSSRQLVEFKIHIGQASHLSLESREERVSEAVNAYINSKLTMLREQNLTHLKAKKVAKEVKERSEGTFLWVSIVFKELENAQDYEVMDILKEMPTGLNELYGKLIQDIKSLKWRNPEYCQSILRAVTTAFRPLTVKEVQELADLPQDVPADTIAKMCRSLLTLRNDTIFLVHQSAKDYLTNEWNTIFRHSIRATHESMFSKSVEAMARTLEQDIYTLRNTAIHVENIRRPSSDPLASIQYACVYWISHLIEAQPCLAKDQVHGFLSVHFLHWFEALSLMESTSACVHALRDLVKLSNQKPGFKPLLPLANDMYRFTRSHSAIVELAPLQAYSSALVFSPRCGLTKLLLHSMQPDWVYQSSRVERHWNGCLTTLIDHAYNVDSVAFSNDGRYVVSASGKYIRFWDAETGILMKVFRDRSEIESVAFGEGGKLMISNLRGDSMKTCDAETGDFISTRSRQTFHDGWSDVLGSSQDGRRYAFLLSTRGIQVADSIRNTGVLTLLGHRELVCAVDFSRDKRLIASGSLDKTIKIWNAVTGAEISTLWGHSGRVSAVAFSPDGRRIVSGSDDKTIRVWDIETCVEGPAFQDHLGHHDQVCLVALTLDGRRIASGSLDNTVKIWDADTGDNIQTIEFESQQGIWSITFSPDGHLIAIATYFAFVVICNVESGATISTYNLLCVGPLALSLNGRYVAIGTQQAIKSQDSEKSNKITWLGSHSGYATSLAFSPKDCHIVASFHRDNTIKIWNLSSGNEIASVNIGVEIGRLKFDTSGAYLHTDSMLAFRCFTWSRNLTEAHTGFRLPQLRRNEYGVSNDRSWITRHGQNIIWLPLEFRKAGIDLWKAADALPHMISLGCVSGRVWWLTFSSQNHRFGRCGQACV